MTICIALTDGTKTYAASDTEWSEPGRVTTHEPKWICCQPYAIGFAGNQHMFQLIKHGYNHLTRSLTDDPALSAWRFRENFVSYVASQGITGSLRQGVLDFDFSMILACPTYVIDYDSSLGYNIVGPNEFVAIGSGIAHARGAYFAMRGTVGNPADLVKLCAAAAIADGDVSRCGGKVWYNEFV